MTDFYLITGFLGAGKTTFLKNFLAWLAPKKTQIIVNEFGKVGVDGGLLAEMNATVQEIAGGSVFCTCRQDHFDAALSRLALDPPEAVVVEASGLSDPTSIRKVLADPRFAGFDYKGCICLVDVPRLEKVYATARPCQRQLSVSDMVLLNKTDIAIPEQLAAARRILRENYPGAKAYETSFGHFQPEWLEAMRPGVHPEEEAGHAKDLTLQKAAIRVSGEMTPEQLEHFLQLFAEDTYRIKGIVRLGGQWLLVDCTGAFVQITPWEGTPPQDEHTLVALAGRGMPLRKSIKNAVAWYPALIAGVELD